MFRNTVRKVHKWIFIFAGLFMFIWLASGVIIALPIHMSWKGLEDRNGDIRYEQVTLSPSEAISLLKKEQPEIRGILSVHFEHIQGKVFYLIQDEGRKSHLVDARTGERHIITRDEAETITRKVHNISQPIVENTILNQHSSNYPWGELPVYRLRFQDEPDVNYYVSMTNAKVLRFTSWNRIKSFAHMLHDFGPIMKFTGIDTLRWGFLVLIGMISLAGAITGIYLIFPVFRRK